MKAEELAASQLDGWRKIAVTLEQPTKLWISWGVSPHTTNCLGRWLAYPMHAEATKHVLLGRKNLGRPATISGSGGNDLGGEQTWGPEHNEMAAVSKKRSVAKSF
jgi:hypothetical protein